jgi:amino acid adenylation domain-containing protein
MSEVLENILQSFQNYAGNTSYQFEENVYSYRDFQKRISTISKFLNSPEIRNQLFIGIDASEIACFETYCQIFACLFSGKCFVPINMSHPKDRIDYMIKLTKIRTILTNEEMLRLNVSSINNSDVNLINTNKLPFQNSMDISILNISDEQYAYLLFTSGSTGFPKGVPLTRGNLFGFVKNFLSLGYELKPTDKFLQMFDFTFDLSIFCYLIPALFGASVCPISSNGVKLSNTINIMIDYNVTAALVVPSILSFIKPYYDEISLPNLKYLFFCGEALSNDLTEKFLICAPNASIVNFYGPTEATIFCTHYNWKKELKDHKHHNGSVTIGKPFQNMQTIIIDENDKLTKAHQMGELCLAGNQLTPGYFKNEEKNKSSFLALNINSRNVRLYRTGDLAFYDDDGDIMFCGRKDFQCKIQGYRVELGDIEYNMRKLLNNEDIVVVAITNSSETIELHCFIKGKSFELSEVTKRINEILPKYMQPYDYHFIETFPLNNNGKVDRNKLKSLVKV